MARCGGSPSPQVLAITSRFCAAAICWGVASAMSSTRAAKPSLPAALRAASASASALPDSVANRMVSGARRAGGAVAAGCGAFAA